MMSKHKWRTLLKPKLLKELCFTIANEKDNLFLILACKDLDKIYCSCYISKSLVSSRGVNASDVISNLSKIIDGKGGGQPFYATCSGTKMDSLNKLISSMWLSTVLLKNLLA